MRPRTRKASVSAAGYFDPAKPFKFCNCRGDGCATDAARDELIIGYHQVPILIAATGQVLDLQQVEHSSAIDRHVAPSVRSHHFDAVPGPGLTIRRATNIAAAIARAPTGHRPVASRTAVRYQDDIHTFRYRPRLRCQTRRGLLFPPPQLAAGSLVLPRTRSASHASRSLARYRTSRAILTNRGPSPLTR